MLTMITMFVAAIFWWRANARFLKGGDWEDRRFRAAWAWALVGGGVGSFFGLAGMGAAINAAPVGALIGYLGASNGYRRPILRGASHGYPSAPVSSAVFKAGTPPVAPFRTYLLHLRRHLGIREGAVFSIHANELFTPVNAGLLVGLARAHAALQGNHGTPPWTSIEAGCDGAHTLTFLMEVESGVTRWSDEGLQEEYEAARKVGSDFFDMLLMQWRDRGHVGQP